MADEPPSSDPTPQPPTSTDVNIAYYKSLVEMAEKGMGRIHDEYRRFIWALTVIISVGIVVVGVFTYKTTTDFKGEMRKEAEVTRSIIQRELELHKEKAINELTNHLNKQIAEQFSTQRIQKTLEKVASTEAKGIIKEQIEPAITEAKNTINSRQAELHQDIDKIRSYFQSELTELHKEVDFQKKFREIQDLHSSAILNCDLKALEALRNYNTESNELGRSASSAVLSIKAFYNTYVPYYESSLRTNWTYGSDVSLKDMHTDELLQRLASSDWRDRSAIAQILMGRKECNVPEALLKLINLDESLCVRDAAMSAFRMVAHFQAEDLFGFQEPQIWYDKNRDRVRNELGCKEQ